MNAYVQEIKDQILPVLKRHGIRRAGLFGSVARGDFKVDSDVDLLVETTNKISLLDFIGIEHEIEKVLGRDVDLVEYHLLKPRIKDKILRQEIRIL